VENVFGHRLIGSSLLQSLCELSPGWVTTHGLRFREARNVPGVMELQGEWRRRAIAGDVPVSYRTQR
jgi:hypothetical protein